MIIMVTMMKMKIPMQVSVEGDVEGDDDNDDDNAGERWGGTSREGRRVAQGRSLQCQARRQVHTHQHHHDDEHNNHCHVCCLSISPMYSCHVCCLSISLMYSWYHPGTHQRFWRRWSSGLTSRGRRGRGRCTLRYQNRNFHFFDLRSWSSGRCTPRSQIRNFHILIWDLESSGRCTSRSQNINVHFFYLRSWSWGSSWCIPGDRIQNLFWFSIWHPGVLQTETDQMLVDLKSNYLYRQFGT